MADSLFDNLAVHTVISGPAGRVKVMGNFVTQYGLQFKTVYGLFLQLFHLLFSDYRSKECGNQNY